MCNARQRIVSLGLLLGLVCGAGSCADEVTIEAGAWTARAGDADLLELSREGERILQRGGARGYLPEWKGARFPTTEATRTAGEGEITWTFSEPRNQDATLTLRLAEGVARYELDTTVSAPGPTEFWVQIVPEAAIGGQRCLMWVDGQPDSLAAAQTFETIHGATELRFDAAERTLTVRTSRGFQLQDRRESGSGLFLVSVIGHATAEPVRAERWIEIELTPAEDPESRRRLIEQAPMEIADVPLTNPGFEAEPPFDGWNASPLASADEQIAHSGERSARLTIHGEVEDRGHVYIIRSVPVTPGRRYRAEAWIRGEDIRPQTQGGMPAVGATAIIEFADSRGWRRHETLYQTFEWRRCGRMRRRRRGTRDHLPALRAWQRGSMTRFEEVTHHAVMLEPMDGVSVDNTLAVWIDRRGGDAGVVEDAELYGTTRSRARARRWDHGAGEPGTGTGGCAADYDATSAVWSSSRPRASTRTTEPAIERRMNVAH